MKSTLMINTTKQGEVEVSLKETKLVLFSKQQLGSQTLLPLIKNALKKAGISLQDLTGISVATGPGSFTGIRVGVSVANALGFALGIHVNRKKMETELLYD
ncbi:tRNA (adenosine(37)-N6)-threonylcarbamoyltransferase complex dimerization subunit type 1 TsaB [Candidatus Daviesbacteria bacterium]|nr:tRNA (adenosine(37)-N6)-threonylcarbamoyltransferase complex dimerization subunit type 1 TsaB [Candidatus Daviesbacteria bacterium]